jgi:hypothetical protein
MTQKEMLKVIGWTKADLRQAERLIEIERLGVSNEALMDEIMRRHRQSEKAAARAVLRRAVLGQLQVSRR